MTGGRDEDVCKALGSVDVLVAGNAGGGVQEHKVLINYIEKNNPLTQRRFTMRSLVCCLTSIIALAILHSATAMESYESVPPEIEKRMEESRS